MISNEQTYGDSHQLLESYLMKRFGDDVDKVSAYLRVLEVDLPQFLNKSPNNNLGLAHQGIYDLQDVEAIELLRSKIKADAVLKNMDMRMSPRCTEALRAYSLFLKSRTMGNDPLPVPGETGSVPGTSKPPVVLQTIYLEGSAAEKQPEEYRRRNKQLREACIAYFRTLHNGRIVCECCGFDFARAYDIEDDYIEVHHRSEFAHTVGEHSVNATTDLVPLCANCHRMIHHNMGGGGKCMSLEELKKKYRGKIYEG